MTLDDVNKLHGGVLPPGVTLSAATTVTRSTPAKASVVKATKGKSRGPPKASPSGDRWSCLNAFVDFSMAGLSRSEMAVWLLLFRDTQRETGLARTGETDLARRCGCTERSIRSAIRALERKNLLRQVKRGDLRSGPSVYKVLPPGSGEV